MTFTTSQDDFLAHNRIAPETWEAANIVWDELVQIANNYLSRQAELSKAASFFAQLIQEIKAVHSVRWRVKDVEHLLEKIVRKRAEATQKAETDNKYLGITVENYGAVVTDLIGLRALHLFKDECFEIDASLKKNFQFPEGEEPKAYVREGDAAEFKKRLEDADLLVVLHPAGYRSIHYIVSSQPLKQLITAEIQVRTIFEEGWSEIDHRVRYPNFSDDPQIARFLDIFNNLAGHADEMGSFVRSLVRFQEETNRQQAEAIQGRDDALRTVEELTAELVSARKPNESKDQVVEKLQKEVALLRDAQAKADNARERLEEGFFGAPYIKSRANAAQLMAMAASATSPGVAKAAKFIVRREAELFGNKPPAQYVGQAIASEEAARIAFEEAARTAAEEVARIASEEAARIAAGSNYSSNACAASARNANELLKTTTLKNKIHNIKDI